MWSFATSLFEKVVHFSPIKTIFQQLFQKFSKDFLQTEPQLSFKDGVLQLDKLKLSSIKINQTFLIGSPYVLHYGAINNIKINLPGNQTKGSKNIQIRVDGIQLIMEPNQHFKETFEQNIKNMKTDETIIQGIKGEQTNNSFSFFKRMLQQFFTNMKIDILNISIKWFMNKPSKNIENKPQYYVMLRIPQIGVERVNDKEVGKIHQDFMKYKTQIPQVSMHILKQDLKAPQYFNLKANTEDIPNYYPPVTHPSTIFLIGRQSQIGKERISIILRISKNIKQKSKQLSINVEDIPNLQLMVSPVQMIVLNKFVEQIQSFKRVYNSVIQKVKAESVPFNRFIDESRDFDIAHETQADRERSSPFKNLDTNKSSMDLFSSFAVSIEQIGGKAAKPPSYFQAIFQNNKEMQAEIGKIQQQMLKQSLQKGQQIQQNEQFKSITIFKLNLHLVRIYVLKYQTSTELFQYQRIWSIDQYNHKSLINNFIPSSYFMLTMNDLIVSFQTNTPTTIKFKQLSVFDVQIKTTIGLPKRESMQPKKIEQISSIDESIDVFQSCTGIPLIENQLKELIRYQINPQYSHYCSTAIFSLSNKPQISKSSQTPIHQHTNFYSPLKSNVLKDKQYGFVLTYQKQQKPRINCNIYSVSLMVDDNFMHDLLMVFRPLITYKYLINTKTDLSSCQADTQIKTNKILNHSIYDFHDQVGHDNLGSLRLRSNTSESQHSKKSNKPQINFQIEEIHVLLQVFKHTPKDLVKNYMNIGSDDNLFDHKCYCEKNTEGVDLNIQYINIKRCPNNNTKLNLMDLSVRVIKSKQRQKQKLEFEDLLHIGKQGRSYPKLSIETITTETIVKKQVITIRVPKFGVVIQKNTPKEMLANVEVWKQKIEQLSELNKYLKEQINKYSPRPIIALKVNPKISKATQIFNVYFERLGLQFLNYQLLVKHVLIKFQQKLFIAKIFQGVLAKTHQPALKLQNPWKSTEFAYYKDDSYEQKFKKYGLRSGIDRVVAYIDKTMQFPLQGQLKQKQYFEILFKLPVPIQVNLQFQNHKYKPNNMNSQQKSFSRPNFSKSSKNEATLKSKVLDIVIRVPIFVKGIQLKDFKYVKSYFDQVKNMFKQSQILNPKNKQRRPSEDNIIPPDTFQEKMIVKVFAEVIHVDVFPYAQCNKDEEIVSHTRSMIQVQDLDVSFNQKETINCSVKIEKLKVKWRQISAYLLVFFDCHIDLNKQVIPFGEIQSYGFKRIMDIKGDFEMIETKTKEKGKQVEISANIYQLQSTFSSHTIGYLDDHIKHILANLQQALKKLNTNINQQYEHQECSDSEGSAEDFDEIDQKLQQIENIKLRQQSQFRSDPVRLIQRQNKQSLILRLNIKQVDIKRICIKITDKPDYQFINYVPRGQNVPLMIELDEKLEVTDDIVIQKHQINKFKRFRTNQNVEGKILKILLENTLLYLQKYQNKLNPKQLNLSLVVNLKVLECNLYVPDDQQTFAILKTIDRFQILVDIQSNKTKVKTAGRRLELGFSSALNYLKNDIKATNQKRKQSMFYVENEHKDEKKESAPTTLMLYLPEMSITLNLKIIGWKFISNQYLSVPSLFFHNVLSVYMAEDNKEFVKQWIKTILTDNLGKLLGNGFTNLVSNSLIGLLICLKQIILLPSHAIGIFKSSR